MLDTRVTNHRQASGWHTCQRCGFDYPDAKLLVQNGLIVCSGPGTVGCRDLPGASAYRKQLSGLDREMPPPPLPQESVDL